jgi:hypothetical protein
MFNKPFYIYLKISQLPSKHYRSVSTDALGTGRDSLGIRLVAYTGIFSRGGGGLAMIFSGGGGSTNSVEDRGQRERGSGGVSLLFWGSTQFSNE